MSKPEKVNVLGIGLSEIDLSHSASKLTYNQFTPAVYICFPSTDTIGNSVNNKFIQKVINDSFITFADGIVTEYYCKFIGHPKVKNVSGYWLLDRLLQTERSHFFYGSDKKTLEDLKINLEKNYPNSNILGYKSPPFVDKFNILNHPQITEDITRINSLKPDFIWIGISSPKQDILMNHYHKYLDQGVMLGVGAVFLYHANVIWKGPEILKKMGLRWVIRMVQNPKLYIKTKIPGYIRFIINIIKRT